MATRRERVVLELEDRFTRGMAEAAAATALLNRELKGLSGSAVQTDKATRDINREIDNTGKSSASSVKEVDKLSGRLRILADVALIGGPALETIGAVGIPAITGLASQLGFAAAGVGTLVLAFHGLGDVLKTVNKAQLEPTAENLEAARIAMADLTPQTQAFVRQLQSMAPEFRDLQNVARNGILPGFTKGLSDAETQLPRVTALIAAISAEVGAIGADIGGSLASGRWNDFLDFLATEGPLALHEMSQAAGNTAHALAELWMATTPLNNDFSSWLVDATADLDRWAAELDQTQGFQDFVAYIEKNGPQVAATFGAIADATLQVVQASAPLGGPVLKGIEALAKVVAKLADSDLGTPIFTALAAMSLYNRALAVTKINTEGAWGNRAKSSVLGMRGALLQVTSAQDRARLSATELARVEGERSAAVRGGLATLGKSTALVAGLGLVASGAADNLGLANTASLAMAGSLAGPWGAAVGAGAGLLLDFSSHADQAAKDTAKFQDSLDLLYAKAGPDAAARLAAVNDQIERVKNTDVTRQIGDLTTDDADKVSKRDSELKVLTGAQKSLRHEIELTAVSAAAAALTNDQYADSVAASGHASEATAAQVAGLVTAMRNNANAASAAFDATTRYRQALVDAAAQAATNNAGIRGNTADALKNRTALAGLRDAWNNQSDAVKNNTKRYDSARSAFIKTAVAMGVPRREARRLADAMLQIPKSRVIDIEFHGHDSLAQIQKIKNQLASIPRKISTEYFVTQVTGVNKHSGGGQDGDPATPQADGGTVPKTGLPYADRHLYLLADGEEIISNRHGQADQFRADRSAGRIPGYAAGGTVGYEINRVESLYNQRAIAAGSFAGSGVGGSYSPQLASIGTDIAGLRAEHKNLTAEVGSLKQQVKVSAAEHAKVIAATRRTHNVSRAQDLVP